MKPELFVLPLFVILIAGFCTLAFAETYEITIPSGAADPNAPFFWSEKSTGMTTGEITIYPGDSVTWSNADTAFHTITSVTKDGEVDGLFDSGFFTAGKSYTRQFNDLGDFYYFCSIHPYMNGVVHVVKNPGSVKSIHGVASGYSNDGLGFDVKYILDVDLQNTVDVNPNGNTLTFAVSGDTLNDQITLILPSKLIDNPDTALVDGNVVDFTVEETSTGIKLVIPIEPHSKEIKIIGTHVIPEFGFVAMGVLSIGLFSTLFLTRSRFSLFR
jgi:plastocyanin